MLSPAFLFSSIWLFVLSLYAFKLTSNLVPMNFSGLSMILGNIAFVIILQKFFVKQKVQSGIEVLLQYEKGIKLFTWLLVSFFSIGILAEIYFFKGFPLLWRLNGDHRLYTQFGFPSIHGVLNACYLQACTLFTLIYTLKKEKKYLVIIVALMIWPILMIGRGILLSAILQCGFIYFFMTQINKKKLWTTFVFILAFIILFGFLGNFRVDYGNPFDYVIAERGRAIFSILPSGFLWIYIYCTAGLANIFYNVDTLVPDYSLNYSVANLIPNVIKNKLNISSVNPKIQLVDPILNTSTAYSGYISDFGAIGGFFGVALILLIAIVMYRSCMRKNPWALASYSVMAQVLVFSVFVDMFLLLPTLFQFVITGTMFVFLKLFIKHYGKSNA